MPGIFWQKTSTGSRAQPEPISLGCLRQLEYWWALHRSSAPLGLCTDTVLTVLGLLETLQMSQYVLLWFYKMIEASRPKLCLQKNGWMQIKPPSYAHRRKSCTPLSTETHLTPSDTIRTRPPPPHRNTTGIFVWKRSAPLPPKGFEITHTLSYSMQACEPLHSGVEGKIYPWSKNQSH